MVAKRVGDEDRTTRYSPPVPSRPNASEGREGGTMNVSANLSSRKLGSTGSRPSCARSRRSVLGEVEDLEQGLFHGSHQGPFHPSEWPTNQSSVIDRGQLIDQDLRIPSQISCRRSPDPQRFGLIHQVSRKQSHEGRRMLRVEQRLNLQDQYGAGPSGLGSAPLIQIRDPHVAALRNRRPLRWRRTRR